MADLGKGLKVSCLTLFCPHDGVSPFRGPFFLRESLPSVELLSTGKLPSKELCTSLPLPTQSLSPNRAPTHTGPLSSTGPILCTGPLPSIKPLPFHKASLLYRASPLHRASPIHKASTSLRTFPFLRASPLHRGFVLCKISLIQTNVSPPQDLSLHRVFLLRSTCSLHSASFFHKESPFTGLLSCSGFLPSLEHLPPKISPLHRVSPHIKTFSYTEPLSSLRPLSTGLHHRASLLMGPLPSRMQCTHEITETILKVTPWGF